jgi:8-amino-7-oxononanoate synthase
MNHLDRRLRTQLDALERAGLGRSPPLITEREGVRYRIHDRPVVGFCSNDYLGLANDPSFAELPHTGSGATASRLVCGDLPEHRRVEAQLADLAGTESAVLFPSGFQLNVGVLPALIEANDPVASDALNHASLIDGLRLTRARATVLPHGAAPPQPTADALAWWVTEALFSMDGDYADPTALRAHLNAGGALYLDEAHSFGLFTINGRPTGFAGHHQLKPTVLVGTLGKSFGCAGAFVAASALTCQWVRACARSFVFSTGPSPMTSVHVEHAITLLSGPEGDLRRARLWANIDRLAAHLGVPPRSPIFSVIIGENQAAMALSTALLERGWHVQAIRPPTVPRGTARLRITMTASHDPSQIDAFAADLRELLAATT